MKSMIIKGGKREGETKNLHNRKTKRILSCKCIGQKCCNKKKNN